MDIWSYFQDLISKAIVYVEAFDIISMYVEGGNQLSTFFFNLSLFTYEIKIEVR